MKTTLLHLYCIAHTSEEQLGLAIIAAVCCDDKNFLFKCGWILCIFREIFLSLVQPFKLVKIRETWQVCKRNGPIKSSLHTRRPLRQELRWSAACIAETVELCPYELHCRQQLVLWDHPVLKRVGLVGRDFKPPTSNFLLRQVCLVKFLYQMPTTFRLLAVKPRATF